MFRGLTIGELAQLTHLSVRTLRRYHESGLLEPASVDPGSGYRYYTAEQIPTAQVIHRLRELDVPLADVAKILATEDAAERAVLVGGHLRRLEEELDRTRAAVVSLRRADDGGFDVELRSVAARTVAAVEGVIDHDDVLTWYAEAMAELDAAVAGLPLLRPPGGRYANGLFTGGRGAVLVYRPVADPPTRGRVRPVTFPPAELAVVVHTGPHDDIDVTCGRLGAWVVGRALTVDGPVHETYLAGPHDDPDPAPLRRPIPPCPPLPPLPPVPPVTVMMLSPLVPVST